MNKAIRIHEHGGPEVLRFEDLPVADPGPGQAKIRHSAIGVNFIDTYHRTGLYPLPLPLVPGMEGAGVVEAVGDGVTEVKPGDRVAYAAGPPGSYAERRLMLADRLIPLPDDVSDEQAAAVMLKGMTVEVLIRRTYAVKAGQTVLWHAAAGGVGLLACQWLKALGVTVIGTVGSEAKAQVAREHGCTHTIVYTREDFVARVRELTDGQGVPVVYDSVGASTFEKSLDCLSPLGMMIVFGNASGKPPLLDVGVLAQKGSLYVTRPVLMAYTVKREDLLSCAGAVIESVRNGALKVEIPQRFSLKDAAQAHRALEARATHGSTILLP